MDLMQLQRVGHFFGWSPPAPKVNRPVKIGLLGASQVGTYALVWPARRVSKAEVVAVAARDGKRALEYARQHGISRAYGSYDELLADPEVDAVYVGLPNGLHGHWARRAMEAGKHVLCEKPFASSAVEVREVQALAHSRGLLCREAFHYREHPLAARLRELVLGNAATQPGLPPWLQAPALPGGQGGLLGPLTSIDVMLLIPKWVFGGANIRFQEQLAGGAMMDAGCYCVNMLRLLSGAEPHVTNATAELTAGSKVVDGAMRADLTWPVLPGLKGSLHASLQHDGWFPETEVRVEGKRGSLQCTGFVMPFFGHSIRVRRSQGDAAGSAGPLQQHVSQATALTPVQEMAAGLLRQTSVETTLHLTTRAAGHPSPRQEAGSIEEWVEHAYGNDHETTYYHQLQRFATDLHVLKGYSNDRSLGAVQVACAGDQTDALANQSVVDAVYRAAGLPLRVPTPALSSSIATVQNVTKKPPSAAT